MPEVHWNCPSIGAESHDNGGMTPSDKPWPRCKRCFLVAEIDQADPEFERFKALADQHTAPNA